MCGIAGIISKSGKPICPEILKRMCDIQAHRGPDDAGYAFLLPGVNGKGRGKTYSRFTEECFYQKNQYIPPFGGTTFKNQMAKQGYLAGLGHRRLAIIDLSADGHQPMTSVSNRFWLAYNGETYNFIDIRNRLKENNYVFTSETDTEVLLYAWEEYGKECLPMLNGMFAFAVYDLYTGLLTIARDRFGIKPLYYAENNDFFVFASEIKAILVTGFLIPEIDPKTLVEYFSFQNIFTDRTLFKGIKILEPGRYVEVETANGKSPRIYAFHHGFPTADNGFNDNGSAAEAVASAFESSVRRQLVSDVELGAYLSGGMDSGSIVSITARNKPRLLTFTCGFDVTNVTGIEQGFDERKLSEELAHLLQTEHYEVVLHSGDMQAVMEKLTWHVDDPRVGMCHQNWYAAKLASRFVKVCLSGAGGDELFAGYPWRYIHGLKNNGSEACEETYFDYWHRLVDRNAMPHFFNSDLHGQIPAVKESFLNIYHASGLDGHNSCDDMEAIVRRMLLFEFKTFLHGILLIEDRISMAHSMEVRLPFLDNELVDLAWKIPVSRKLHQEKLNGCRKRFFKADEGKIILRHAMEKFLPVSFTQQPKQGFSPPDENWYRGPSIGYIKSILLDEKTKNRPWFDQAFIQARLKEHFEGQHNHRLLIWSLLTFEWLQRHFIDNQVNITA